MRRHHRAGADVCIVLEVVTESVAGARLALTPMKPNDISCMALVEFGPPPDPHTRS
jgi:hypothetical protein